MYVSLCLIYVSECVSLFLCGVAVLINYALFVNLADVIFHHAHNDMGIVYVFLGEHGEHIDEWFAIAI